MNKKIDEKKSRILEIWSDLVNSKYIGFYKQLYESNKPFHIYGTYDSLQKYYGIGFIISNDYKININSFSNLKDLKVSLMIDSSFVNSRFLSIQLKNTYYIDVFSSLCENLILSVIDLSSEKERISTVINQLEKWKSMFNKVSSDGLTQSQQQGLFGELHFLEKFLSCQDVTPIDVLSTWVGVDAAMRDFQGTNWAVEVKTSSTNNPQSVKINGERQLDETLLDTLILYHCSVEVSKSNGQSLPQKIAQIREKLNNDVIALNCFNAKIFEVGYVDKQEDLYNDRCYKIRNESFYHIKDDFPRIKENELRKGVGDVKYSISLATCNEYLIPENKVLNVIKSI
jgi:hypothetical protein